MADVELPDLRNGGDRLDIVEGEAVAGMGLDAVLGREGRCVGDAAQLRRPFFPLQMGVTTGMELDDRCPKADRGLDLAWVGLDEQADSDPRLAEPGDEGMEVIVLPRRVEAALGRPFFPFLGHDAGGVRAVAKRDLQHLLGRRHFEVERNGELRPKRLDILVPNVASVLAEMGGDAVGAGFGGEQGRFHRIGMIAAARVPDGRDMVDIDAEAEVTGHAPSTRLGTGAFRLPGFSAGSTASSGGSACGS